VTGAVDVAIVAGVTIVEAAGLPGMAFAGLHRHQTPAARWKALKLDGGKCVLAQKTRESADSNKQSFPHIVSRRLMAAMAAPTTPFSLYLISSGGGKARGKAHF
jgi:hypothetical protein